MIIRMQLVTDGVARTVEFEAPTYASISPLDAAHISRAITCAIDMAINTVVELYREGKHKPEYFEVDGQKHVTSNTIVSVDTFEEATA